MTSPLFEQTNMETNVAQPQKVQKVVQMARMHYRNADNIALSALNLPNIKTIRVSEASTRTHHHLCPLHTYTPMLLLPMPSAPSYTETPGALPLHTYIPWTLSLHTCTPHRLDPVHTFKTWDLCLLHTLILFIIIIHSGLCLFTYIHPGLCPHHTSHGFACFSLAHSGFYL